MSGNQIADKLPKSPSRWPALSFLAVKEVAALCKVSERTIDRLIESGELAVIHVRRQIRIQEQSWERWFEAQTNRAAS